MTKVAFDKIKAGLGDAKAYLDGSANKRAYARESGRSSIPETLVINGNAAAYWILRIRGV